jgi:hypothetical protein
VDKSRINAELDGSGKQEMQSCKAPVLDGSLPHRYWLLPLGRFIDSVLCAKPFSDLLRIESYCSTHAKTRKLSTRGHAVNVLIVYSQYGRKVGNLDATTPGFQLFNQIEFHAIPPGYLFNSPVPDDPAMYSSRTRGIATSFQRGSRGSRRALPTSAGFCD